MGMQSAVTGQPRIDSEKIFTFPQGIPSFEEYTTFRIFHKDDDAVSAYRLESDLASCCRHTAAKSSG